MSILTMFSYHFIQRALIVGVLVSLCAALLGVSLVLKRYSMIGDGLSHVGFGALAVASAFHLAPLAVTVPVVVLSAILLLRLRGSSRVKGDAAIAIISSSALAIGVIVVSVTSGMNTEVSSYLFGSILSLSRGDAVLSVILSLAVLALFLLFYPRLFAVTFDETFARATGTRADLYNTLLAVLTAVTVVIGMRMMGALLISSLIIFPAELPRRDPLRGAHLGRVLPCRDDRLLRLRNAQRRQRRRGGSHRLRPLLALRTEGLKNGRQRRTGACLRPGALCFLFITGRIFG